MAGEFDLIEQFFSKRQTSRKDVLLSIGDDCALVKPPEFSQIAVSTDTMVAGTHFLADADPAWLARKALSSNLSDLAAMGAVPAWVSLALTLPEMDTEWLKAFSDAFHQFADYYDIQLIGGDTTKGPMSITLTVQGLLPEGKALTRRGASVGDWIYVTGNLGDAKAGLDVILNTVHGGVASQPSALLKVLEKRHFESTPRIYAGQQLLNRASAAIDISDGLYADLSHILSHSSVSARLDVDALPLSAELQEYCSDPQQAQQYALTSGEEYELCFIVPELHRGSIEIELANIGTHITCIGQIQSGSGIVLHASGEPLNWTLSGFDHFNNND
ncbi:thiamine-phosphate kinase [Vibrio ulleungensis]|uniref:Thiamine-monophosphate kinase n=1 Tax=Vibrio ulleungensis TaxID=2807619 RepID=A0ABS2HQH4_9VIBR|nr:thiamine-phosphate kinase [Vibrio ulleungensis]MBM7038127.1 thiamine-phosphate kinase [Vibrio ulleungensis]